MSNVFYEDLNEEDKELLTEMCQKYFLDEPFCNICNCYNSVILIPKDIPEELFSLGRFILENRCRTEGIFRIPGNSNIYSELVSKIKNKENIDFKEYETDDLCSAFKMYCRDILYGIFHIEIHNKYSKNFIETKSEELCYRFAYSMFEIELKFLKLIKEIILKISQNIEVTKLDVEECLFLLGMSITAPDSRNSINEIYNIVERKRFLIAIDLNIVPQFLLNELKEYKINK